MSEHPAYSLGCVLLYADPSTGAIDPFGGSVVATGYDPVRRLVYWKRPRISVDGFGPVELYRLAPEGWEDPPAPPESHRSAVESAHDLAVPREELQAAEAADQDSRHRARRIRDHEANIAWAQRHLVRIDPYRAAEMVERYAQAIELLRAEEREHLAAYREQIEAALGWPSSPAALGEIFTMDEFRRSERQ